MARRLLLVCFEGLGTDFHRVFSRFVRGSPEISPVSSLYRESTDSLIFIFCVFYIHTVHNCHDHAISHCVVVIVCDVEFGYWVCGESWLDSLTHRPSSQGWAPSVLLSCHVMCICVCVFKLFGGL